MSNDRPKIKVPFEPIDIIIESISIVLLILLIIYTLLSYQDLPDSIPTHFNSRGEADDFGSKTILIFLPILVIVLYIGLFILNKYPHIHNYMLNITEENALKNYRFSTKIVRYTNLFMAIVFMLVQYMIVESSHGRSFSFENWFVPVILGVSFIVPIILIIYQSKMNK